MIISDLSNVLSIARIPSGLSARTVAFGLIVLAGASLCFGSEALESVGADLERIFAGEAPKTVSQLKAMERHQQHLAANVTASTVGVIVGPSHGSGVIISEDGYVLTAAHVGGEPNRPAVFILPDGQKVHGKTLGVYRTLDAGLMKITDEGPWPHAELAERDNVQLGQWCIAVGHPGGFQEGRQPVVRIGRVLKQDRFAIKTDCTLVGGDSGGPLFDMHGCVIGINSRIGQALTTNLHVPASVYRQTWDRLVTAEAWGSFLQAAPYIGVQGDGSPDVARISVVRPDTPAERAGIKPGDTIIRFNGKDVTDFASLQAHVSDTQPGDKVLVRVVRNKRQYEISLTVGQRK